MKLDALSASSANRIEGIDALRGLASLAVCFYHFTCGNSAFLPEGWLKTTGSYGWLGVEVFFVISGFIIPYSLHRAGYGLSEYGRFVLKRVVRLDPPYLATIGIIIFLGYLVLSVPDFKGPPFSASAPQVALHLAYLNVFFGYDWLSPVFWTLAIEFQYYLLVGLLFPLIAHSKTAIRLGLFAILGLLAFSVKPGEFIFHWFFLFMLGMLAFQRKAGLVNVPVFITMLILLAAGSCITLGGLIGGVGIASALLISFARLHHKILVFLGSISYSLYLIHVPVGMKLINLGSRFADSFLAKISVLIIALGLTIIVAYLLYRLVEQPAQQWSSRLKYRPRKPAALAPAAGNSTAA